MNAVVETVPLTEDEDTFALAVIEYGGNLGAAFKAAFPNKEVRSPVGAARELICRPEIAKRIQELTLVVEESALISRGSHIVKLAEIRDLAIGNNQLKVALDAEKTRGDVAGLYKGPSAGAAPVAPTAAIQINIGATPANVGDWAAKHGKAPIVVDLPSK